MYEEFGKWLKRHRKRLGLTQKQLAAKTTFSDNYISKLERAAPHWESGGDVQPSKKFVAEIAAAIAETSAQRDLFEKEGRVLAGWPESDTIPTMAQINEILRQNPQNGVLFMPGEEGYTVVNAEGFMQKLAEMFAEAVEKRKEIPKPDE